MIPKSRFYLHFSGDYHKLKKKKMFGNNFLEKAKIAYFIHY